MISLFSSFFIIPTAITSAVFCCNFKLGSKPPMETLNSWGCTKPWRIPLETLIIWLHIGNYLASCKPDLNPFNLCPSHQEQLTRGLPGMLLNSSFFIQFLILIHYSLFSRNEIHESTDISAVVPNSHSGSLHIWWEISQHFHTMNVSYFSYSQIPKKLKKIKKKWRESHLTFILFHWQTLSTSNFLTEHKLTPLFFSYLLHYLHELQWSQGQF